MHAAARAMRPMRVCAICTARARGELGAAAGVSAATPICVLTARWSETAAERRTIQRKHSAASCVCNAHQHCAARQTDRHARTHAQTHAASATAEPLTGEEASNRKKGQHIQMNADRDVSRPALLIPECKQTQTEGTAQRTTAQHATRPAARTLGDCASHGRSNAVAHSPYSERSVSCT
jgi:hypothetical protein